MGRKTWGEAEGLVAANAGHMSDEELARAVSAFLGRYVSTAALKKKRQRMGLRKRCFVGGLWSGQEGPGRRSS